METIGFIGLALMGKPMAANLPEAGFPLVVHPRSRPRPASSNGPSRRRSPL
jgi:3-hydroxyisobutyrate dehydrogenase-like beta-hydroxyacid dehydrogenase